MNRSSLPFAKQAAEARAPTRRENSRLLIASLGDFLNCQLLFPDLSGTVVPFSFLMLFDVEEDSSPAVAEKAAPVFRFGNYAWKRVGASVCPAIAHSSRNLSQLLPLSSGADSRRASPEDREHPTDGGQTRSPFQAPLICVSRPDRLR